MEKLIFFWQITTKHSSHTDKMAKKTKVSKASAKKQVEEPKPETLNKIEEGIVHELNVKDSTIEKAVSALSKWNKQQAEKSEKKDLFETDDEDIPIFLQVTSNKYFSTDKIIKPRMLELPHPIYDLDEIKVCLFVKDDLISPENDDLKERIEILKNDELKNLSEIVTVKELKTKYQSYESRRKLLNDFDIFLTDSSIANMIPKLLGKIFFKSSKTPLTIQITDHEKKLSIEKLIKNFNKALNSVGYMLPMGINLGFKLGMLGQNIDYLKENIQTILKFLQKFPIRVIHLKLKDSPSLPIYITDKVYNEEDILKPNEDAANIQGGANDGDDDDIPVAIYTEGLKELGLDEEEADKILGRKRTSNGKTENEPSRKKSKK